MKVSLAADIIRRETGSPVQTWLDYTPQGTPMVVYDGDEFIFLNHPDPPTERPGDLTAATAMEVNGIVTATIPAAMCEEERSLVPLAYHECFHVYQGKVFHGGADYDFFEVLAFYPELDPAYRALCSAETDVINDSSLSPIEQARYVAALTEKRHAILARHPGLLEFEKDLERNEGTASFVEQQARSQIYGVPPDNAPRYYNYSRQYFMGPAICYLLQHLCPASEWQQAVQQGTSLTEFLLQALPPRHVQLDDLRLPGREQEEGRSAEKALADANERIAGLLQGGTIKIKLPQQARVFRSFNPRSIISLGDGRLIHPEFVMIQIPNGQIAIQGEMTLEDYRQGTVILRAVPYRIDDGKLEVRTDTIRISLSNVGEVEGLILVL